MMDRSTLLEAPPDSPAPPEAVIREARRRQRRRWVLVAGIAIVVVAVVAAIVFGSTLRSGRRPTPPATRTRVRTSPPVHAVVSTRPSQPGPLAVAPDGTLYVADEAQNRILARLPSGRFRVVAGNGQKGFSGDGGPAVDAELNDPQGITVGANGTVYFADQANNRIRAVSPGGTITTVAGNGQGLTSVDLPESGMPAVSAAVPEPTAVTIGPDGSLYVATGADVLKVDADGDLHVIEDGPEFDAFDPGLMFLEQCYPASLAFDRAGDLYIGCSSPWVLLVRTPDGSLHSLGMVRPHDAWAAMTPTPEGGVLAIEGTNIVAYGSATGPAPVDFLTYRLPDGSPFWPQGIAATADGSVYLSQDGVSGIGPATILDESPSGALSVIWQTKSTAGSRPGARG
jgi:sugar lactone lactonase YvrE